MITKNGSRILTTAHDSEGSGRAARRKFETMEYDEIICKACFQLLKTPAPSLFSRKF